ncbi:MAG: hypothetical protein M3352_12080 [Bacteroidota bacterium]|jgi:hypothetical protein|nr:hypothetical protein [Bacteroidota bacterium]
MRKFSAKNAILLLAISIIAILFLSFHNLNQSKKELCKTACSKGTETLKDGSDLLWESLSRQFVNSVSSY